MDTGQPTLADQLYGMKLADRLELPTHFVTRVPGGWLWTERVALMGEMQTDVKLVGIARQQVMRDMKISSVFVPFDSEFDPAKPRVN